MEPLESVQQLLELAGSPPPRRRRFSLPAGASATAAAAAPPVAAASRPASAGSALRSSLAKELNALDHMFQHWKQEAAAKRAAAASARDFREPNEFSLALVVLNKRGELRRGTCVAQWQQQLLVARVRVVGSAHMAGAEKVEGNYGHGTRVCQSWYFVPRQASSAAGELPCTRCCEEIRRRETFFVDRAAREWRQADEVCRGCMLCMMRSLLGDDDAAILEEAQAILGSAWRPTVNSALAEALQGERRPRLAEL